MHTTQYFLPCGAIFTVSIVVNEFSLQYVHSRYILMAWAILCLWILLDSSPITASLLQAELSLKDQTKHNEALHAENMLLAKQMLQVEDNHRLLCEIRTRIIHLCKRHKEQTVMLVQLQARISEHEPAAPLREVHTPFLVILESAPNCAAMANAKMMELFGFKLAQLQRSLKLICGPLTDAQSFATLQKQAFHGNDSHGRFTFYNIVGDAIECKVHVSATMLEGKKAIRATFQRDP